MTTPYRLPAETHIGYAHLSVASLDQALDFYERQLGLHPIRHDNATVTLSANDQSHIILTEKPGATPKPGRAIGLYHVAIRLPSRVALARVFARLIQERYPFGGFSDHAVSEALYLSDPDGNGLELYTDRPRDQWPRHGDQIAMVTEPLDIDDLLNQAEQDSSPWQGIDSKTDVGHVHLHVSSLERAHAFYVDLLGMDLVADWRAHASPLMHAIIWYRLPVSGDRLNWSARLLTQVAAGATLKRGWVAAVRPNQEGHCEIVLQQKGEAPDDLPREVLVSWQGGEAEGCDGLRGYKVTKQAPGSLTLRLEQPARFGRVQPEQQIVAGWLRLPEGAEVKMAARIIP